MSLPKYIKVLSEGEPWVIGRNDVPGGFCVCEPQYFFDCVYVNESSSTYVAYADIPENAEKVNLGTAVKASAVILYEPLIPLHEFIPKAIEAGADIHSVFEKVLRSASEYGHLDVVKCLLNYGIPKKHQALILAAFHGHADVVKYLLECGTRIHDVHKNETLELAAQNGHADVVKCLLEHEADVRADEYSAFTLAVEKGHAAVVKCLLEHGADVHHDDDKWLRYAALEGHLDVVKCLVEHDADVHAHNDEAIRWASLRGHQHVVQYLLDHIARHQ